MQPGLRNSEANAIDDKGARRRRARRHARPRRRGDGRRRRNQFATRGGHQARRRRRGGERSNRACANLGTDQIGTRSPARSGTAGLLRGSRLAKCLSQRRANAEPPRRYRFHHCKKRAKTDGSCVTCGESQNLLCQRLREKPSTKMQLNSDPCMGLRIRGSETKFPPLRLNPRGGQTKRRASLFVKTTVAHQILETSDTPEAGNQRQPQERLSS